MKKFVKENLNEFYNEEEIHNIGLKYKEFQQYITSLNYDDLIEYAEKLGEFKTLNILDYLKLKSKYI